MRGPTRNEYIEHYFAGACAATPPLLQAGGHHYFQPGASLLLATLACVIALGARRLAAERRARRDPRHECARLVTAAARLPRALQVAMCRELRAAFPEAPPLRDLAALAQCPALLDPAADAASVTLAGPGVGGGGGSGGPSGGPDRGAGTGGLFGGAAALGLLTPPKRRMQKRTTASWMEEDAAAETAGATPFPPSSRAAAAAGLCPRLVAAFGRRAEATPEAGSQVHCTSVGRGGGGGGWRGYHHPR
jgi:hypothetical protein